MNYIQAMNKIGQIIVEKKFGELIESKKIEIKATYIKNDSTNNSLESIKEGYDFLMIAVFKNSTSNPRFLCFNRQDVIDVKGDNKKISISEAKSVLKPELLKYEIRTAQELKEKLEIK